MQHFLRGLYNMHGRFAPYLTLLGLMLALVCTVPTVVVMALVPMGIGPQDCKDTVQAIPSALFHMSHTHNMMVY